MAKSVERPDFEKWTTKGLPAKGWVYKSMHDLGEPTSTCDMCGTTIRYVHRISHFDVEGDRHVGCVCASHLTQDPDTPRANERSAKSKAARLDRLSKNLWHETPKGYSTKLRGIRCTVFQPKEARHNGGWKFVVNAPNLNEGKAQFSMSTYPTLESAKRACYEAIITIKDTHR